MEKKNVIYYNCQRNRLSVKYNDTNGYIMLFSILLNSKKFFNPHLNLVSLG